MTRTLTYTKLVDPKSLRIPTLTLETLWLLTPSSSLMTKFKTCARSLTYLIKKRQDRSTAKTLKLSWDLYKGTLLKYKNTLMLSVIKSHLTNSST